MSSTGTCANRLCRYMAVLKVGQEGCVGICLHQKFRKRLQTVYGVLWECCAHFCVKFEVRKNNSQVSVII